MVDKGLPDGTIDITSRTALANVREPSCPRESPWRIAGDANDYVGSVSGGRIVVRPLRQCAEGYVAEDNIIGGNVILFGATSAAASARWWSAKIRGAQPVGARCGRGCRRPRLRVHDRWPQSGHPAAPAAPPSGMSGGVAYVSTPTRNCRKNQHWRWSTPRRWTPRRGVSARHHHDASMRPTSQWPTHPYRFGVTSSGTS